MKKLMMIAILCALGGCHHQAPRVDCDKHLEPVNAPAPAMKPIPKPSSTP